MTVGRNPKYLKWVEGVEVSNGFIEAPNVYFIVKI